MVSIIIPVYNVERYLKECLDSILAQIEKDWEAILIDDGSTDNSGAICDEYAKFDDRIIVIHQKNSGAANAKNTGLDVARGEYIAFLDSDDTVDSSWLSIVKTELNNSDVVEFNFDYHYTIGYKSASCFESAAFDAESYLVQYLDNWQCSLFWNKVFRATLINDIRFRKERRCIDDEFFTYKVVANANRIVRIPNVLYHYRQRLSSAVFNQKNLLQKTDDALEILKERYLWISERYPLLRRKYLKHDIEILFYFGRSFLFTKDTSRKFRILTKYYLKQCLIYFPGIIDLINAIHLLKFTDRVLLSNRINETIIDQENYFV